jgi:hypothetical protein
MVGAVTTQPDRRRVRMRATAAPRAALTMVLAERRINLQSNRKYAMLHARRPTRVSRT